MIETKKIDEEWLADLRKEGFTADSVYSDGRWEALKLKILGYGGEAVVLAYKDSDHPKMLERGVCRYGSHVVMMPRMSNVHENIARLSIGGLVDSVCTGYALSQDGVWRQHSWGLKDGVIVETVEPKVAYFGFTLTDEEENEFCFKVM